MNKDEILEKIRQPIRCPNCNKLIAKLKVWGDFDLEYICPRCKNKIHISRRNRQFDKKQD